MSDPNSITIKASGNLKQHIQPGARAHNVRTVGEAISQLNLPESGDLMIMLNGQLAYWHTEVEDGDVLHLLPAISGG